jgi:predicted CXXCH cytochrome family protein
VSLVVAAVLGAGACDEHVPSPLANAGAIDAGPPDAGMLEAPPPPIAPAARRDEASSPVVFDPVRGGVWTANGDAGSVSYVDIDARKVVQELVVGKDVRTVALSPDARFVAAVDREAGAVILIDAETRALRATVPLGTHPRAAVFDAWDPRWLYVTLEDDGAIALVDRSYGRVVRSVPVGRLPAALGVSARRHELAVAHRIDPKVTVLSLDGVYSPLDQDVPPDVIPIADEEENDDPTVPQGRPFAFESMAWAPDGTTAWLPHELLALRQPLQFQTTLFPAISVVDVGGRAEVENDPAAPDTSAGRKTLFAQIDIPDPAGATSIVSQPCAVRFHPSGILAYALACASEDLLVFDAKTGLAVDLVRGLPGDHPVGIAVEDTGQRAFVLSDQSKTLTLLDLAGGSPLAHVAPLGPPIPLVAKDPVDPEMREGLRLFFRANSGKGAFATTGNDWMSCGGCHLDGFVSTNLVFFEALKPASRATDAQIGHVGLKDLFSTAPTPADPSFDPHDILVAFSDQGGLAPDRSGAHRDGAIDPSKPPADARLMATRIARVIARDLPLGPSWLLPGAEKPKVEYDGAWCGNCHKPEYEAWQKSAHAHAAQDPMVAFGAGVEVKARGPQYTRLCAGCHDPVTSRIGDTSLRSGRGITCLGCHDTERMIRAGGNADSEARAHDWTKDHRDWATASLATLRRPEFCGGCHQQFVPAGGIEAISTLHEWQDSPYSVANAETVCVDCHAPRSDGESAGVKMPVADHAMIGGNVYLASRQNDPALVDRVSKFVRRAIQLDVKRGGDVVLVNVLNKGAGHAFPTGVADIREPWLELQAVDAGKTRLARYGGPDSNGLIPAGAARFGFDIAKPDGTLLFLHELSETTKIPFDRRIQAHADMNFVFHLPPAPPSGTAEFDVVLYYRNVRTPYFRAATGDPNGAAPDVEVARAVVP